jgi:hypothetical protein
MVVATRELVRRTVENLEQQADAARIARDFVEMARLRFRAVWFREWLMAKSRFRLTS